MLLLLLLRHNSTCVKTLQCSAVQGLHLAQTLTGAGPVLAAVFIPARKPRIPLSGEMIKSFLTGSFWFWPVCDRPNIGRAGG